MNKIKDNEIFNTLCKEFNIKIPQKLQTEENYHEFKTFKDYEYIYCITYELLIRTEEYALLVRQYNDLIHLDINENERKDKINQLISKMKKLGLTKYSFNNFDCGDGNVFEKIALYNEISNSPWTVRTLNRFELENTEIYNNALDQLIDFYYDKKELYIRKSNQYVKTDIHPRITIGMDDKIFFPCIDLKTNKTVYKALNETILLKELQKDFLSTLKEKKEKELLKQEQSNFIIPIEYWHRFQLDEIDNGIEMLINYSLSNDKIKPYKKKDSNSKNDILRIYSNPEKFYILSKGKKYQLSPSISLDILEDDFLSQLKYSDLLYNNIGTDTIFSRPKVFFDEARLVNLPINLNLPKDELLYFIAQIKDEFDADNYIIKTPLETDYELVIESDFIELPSTIKHKNIPSKTKKLFPTERKKFKNNFAKAFYIYDLYKFFLPYFEQKTKLLKDEKKISISKINKIYKFDRNSLDKNDKINDQKESMNSDLKNYELNNLITQIQYLCKDLSEEQVKFYLSTLKEFINGRNLKNENNKLKKQYKSKDYTSHLPKYKNLIIGNSSIITSNHQDIIKILFNQTTF